MLNSNNLEKIDHQLLGWHNIKRKYISGIIITSVGTNLLIVGLMIVYYFFPDLIVYHYDVIVYNGTLIKLYVEIVILSLGGLLFLIGLPLLIINTIKKKKL
ncbi:MAG: hypothetical protein ACFFCI_06935 [Promethearchaeota archaeon]